MYLSTTQACARIGVGRATLAKLIRDGELPGAIKGPAKNSHVKIPEESVNAYLAKCAIIPVAVGGGQ